jgi:uracil-DNA glycosylase family 4
MCNSARVLNYSAGNLNSEIFFIGETPGRLGADETEVPFHGDTAGKNFEDLLSFAGLSRNDLFVTNAVLCNPKDEKGNNSTPSPIEVANCQHFLRRQIEIVNPKIVVTLGATALRAIAGIELHGFTLSQHVRTIHAWFGRSLIPLYHPGQRAMIHRSFANQRSDYHWKNPHSNDSDFERRSRAFTRLREQLRMLIPIPAEPFHRRNRGWEPKFKVELDGALSAVREKRFAATPDNRRSRVTNTDSDDLEETED